MGIAQGQSWEPEELTVRHPWCGLCEEGTQAMPKTTKVYCVLATTASKLVILLMA